MQREDDWSALLSCSDCIRGSGKSTLATALKQALSTRFDIVAQDDYIDTDAVEAARQASGSPLGNYETPDAIDWPSLWLAVRLELCRATTRCPVHSPSGRDQRAFRGLDPAVVICEGFLLFARDPELCGATWDARVFVCATRETCRARREATAPAPQGYFDNFVWPSFVQWNREVADASDVLAVDGEADVGAEVEAAASHVRSVVAARLSGTPAVVSSGNFVVASLVAALALLCFSQSAGPSSLSSYSFPSSSAPSSADQFQELSEAQLLQKLRNPSVLYVARQWLCTSLFACCDDTWQRERLQAIAILRMYRTGSAKLRGTDPLVSGFQGAAARAVSWLRALGYLSLACAVVAVYELVRSLLHRARVASALRTARRHAAAFDTARVDEIARYRRVCASHMARQAAAFQ
eukprot:m51a1_g9000 hypothetical protein (409) ;mRNA; f:103640-105465